jgi:hypothetical protein
MWPQPKTKSDKSEMVNCSRNEFGPHRLMAQGSSFRQYIGAWINPVVPALPIVPAFRLFLLSCHSSFPSFQLSSHSGNYLVVPVTKNIRN